MTKEAEQGNTDLGQENYLENKLQHGSKGYPDLFVEVYNNPSLLDSSCDSKTKELLVEKICEEGDRGFLFLNALIDFSARKSLESDTSKVKSRQLEDFLKEIIRYFFDSTQLIESLSLQELLLSCSRATQVPELRGWLGRNLISALVWRVDRYDPDEVSEQLRDLLKGCQVGDVLDLINLFPTILSVSYAETGRWSKQSKTIENFFELTKAYFKQPFVQYALKLSLASLVKEQEGSSLGIWARRGDLNEGRLLEGLPKEEHRGNSILAAQIRPNIRLLPGFKVVKSASDTITVLDQSNHARYYGRYDHTLVKGEDEPIVPIPRLNEAIEWVESIEQDVQNSIKIRRYLEYFKLGIIIPYAGIATNDYQNIAEKFSSISDVLSKKEWQELIYCYEQYAIFIKKVNRYSEEVNDQIQIKNNEIIAVFLEHFQSQVSLLGRKENSESGDHTNKELQEHINEGRHGYALAAAEAIILGKIEKDKAASVPTNQKNELFGWSHLYEQLVQLKKQLSTKIVDKEKLIEKYALQCFRESAKIIKRMNALEDKIIEQNGRLALHLKKTLLEIRNVELAGAQRVDFKPYLEISEDKNALPFYADDPDLPLLLTHLHRPALRKMIEDDLGVKLEEIPFRSQVHLLRFLA
ncbi:MAG TPA: hypothetical protein PK263_00705, partial [bacterium]|nr:hypothetical protein [bacterium]